MAENLNPIENTENTQSLEKIANATEDNGSDVSKIREKLEGFTPIVDNTEEIKRDMVSRWYKGNCTGDA